jgi:hypothetical protein
MASGDLAAAAQYAVDACRRASDGSDASMSISAEVAAAAVALAESGSAPDRARLTDLVDRRTSSDAGRFVAMFGGAVGASLDEPDVVALMASL